MKKIILAAALALSGLSLPVHASSEIDTATQAKVTASQPVTRSAR